MIWIASIICVWFLMFVSRLPSRLFLVLAIGSWTWCIPLPRSVCSRSCVIPTSCACSTSSGPRTTSISSWSWYPEESSSSETENQLCLMCSVVVVVILLFDVFVCFALFSVCCCVLVKFAFWFTPRFLNCSNAFFICDCFVFDWSSFWFLSFSFDVFFFSFSLSVCFRFLEIVTVFLFICDCLCYLIIFWFLSLSFFWLHHLILCVAGTAWRRVRCLRPARRASGDSSWGPSTTCTERACATETSVERQTDDGVELNWVWLSLIEFELSWIELNWLDCLTHLSWIDLSDWFSSCWLNWLNWLNWD